MVCNSAKIWTKDRKVWRTNNEWFKSGIRGDGLVRRGSSWVWLMWVEWGWSTVGLEHKSINPAGVTSVSKKGTRNS